MTVFRWVTTSHTIILCATLTLLFVKKTDGGLDRLRTSRLLIFLMRVLMSGLYLRKIYKYTRSVRNRSEFAFTTYCALPSTS